MARKLFIKGKELPENENREKIIRAVENDQMSLRELSRELDIPFGTLVYSVGRLVHAGVLKKDKDTRYAWIGLKGKEYGLVVHNEIQRKMIRELSWNGASGIDHVPSRTQRQLSVLYKVSRSTMSFHCNELYSNGIIRRVDMQPEDLWSLRGDFTLHGIYGGGRHLHLDGKPFSPIFSLKEQTGGDLSV